MTEANNNDIISSMSFRETLDIVSLRINILKGVIKTLIVFDSFTGNVERFIKKVGLDAVKIKEGLIIKEPFVLVTYTTGMGNIPPSTAKFLARGSFINMKAVASSGNRNWIPMFAEAGVKISKQFNVPLLLKFENDGTKSDVEEFIKRVGEMQ
ncbi:ribonucleotide reductase [Bacillus phage vB_BanS-Thrax3]|nr:ribonucleotide reductase [Bacillus phage vB_BanS-Thrax3]